jgi:formiminotetrahydrofolate cyclodeaminase
MQIENFEKAKALMDELEVLGEKISAFSDPNLIVNITFKLPDSQRRGTSSFNLSEIKDEELLQELNKTISFLKRRLEEKYVQLKAEISEL